MTSTSLQSTTKENPFESFFKEHEEVFKLIASLASIKPENDKIDEQLASMEQICDRITKIVCQITFKAFIF